MNTDGSPPRRVLLDLSTRIAAIDGRLAADLGYDTADLLNAPFSRLLSPSDIEDVGSALVSLVRGDRPAVTTRRELRTVDGAPLPAVLSLATRSGADGSLQGFTAAILVDADHEHSTPMLPDHLRRLDLAAALIDADGRLLDTNMAWGQLFAVADAVLHASPLDSLVARGDRGEIHRRLEELRHTERTSSRLDVRCETAKGTIWARLSIVPTSPRCSHFTVTAEDVSAELLTRRVLTANEAHFRSLTEGSPVGIARLTTDLTIAYANAAFLTMTASAEGQPPASVLDAVHPDDRERVGSVIRQRLRSGDSEPVQCRLAASDGSPQWAALRFASVNDDQLGVIGRIVTAVDITDFVAERPTPVLQLAASAHDLVGIGDLRTGEILHLNETARTLFGVDDTATIGSLYPEVDSQTFVDDIYPVLRRGERWTGELAMRAADGSTLRIYQTITADLGADGEPEQVSAIGTNLADERRSLGDLAYLATHDLLTGLPNRGLLLDHLQLALARSQRDRRPIAVLFIDLDRFKAVNDTHGHDAGDMLLKDVARALSDVLRPSDTVARLGGDEFVVLCEDIDGEIDAMTIASRIRDSLTDDDLRVRGIPADITLSIGVALSGPNTSDPEVLLQQADAAMYRAKQSGRGRIELFDDVLRDRNRRREGMRQDLEQALEDLALDVHYQPIVDLGTGHVVAVEAFARWLHPTRGLLTASDFLELAVTSGLDVPLDRLVLSRACADAAHWVELHGDNAPRLHVNATARSVLSGSLLAELERCLSVTGLPATKLCVELSERFLMDDVDVTAERLDRIREFGVALAIDGVGTGATSLQHLRRYQLDMLKVDSTLTADMLTDSTSQRLVGAAIALGRALDLSVGAESIESADAIPILQRLGAQMAQGNVFTEALPAERVTNLLPLRSVLVDSPVDRR